MSSDVKSFTINVFGRLRMKAHPTQLGPGETHSMLNIDYEVPGARNKRKGYQKQYATSIGTSGIKGMVTYDPRFGDPQELVFHGTKVYKDVGGTLIDVLTELTPGIVDSIQTNDQLFFLNETNCKRYDGINFFPWGVTAPTSAPTVIVGAAGSLSGAYQYKIVFVDSKGGLSNPSPASTSVSPSSQKVNLSAIPVGAAGTDVVKRQIYRTLANQTDYFYYLGVIEDNTTTTYEDNIPDSGLGAKIQEDNAVCPKGSFCFHWNSRAWVNDVDNPQRIHLSKILRPEQFETSLEIEASDGQAVTAGIEFGDCALIGKERGLYRIRGDVATPSEVVPGVRLFEIKALKSHVGPCNWRVFQKIDAWAMFLSKYEGLWCVITSNDTDGIPNVVYAGEDVESLIKGVTDFTPENCWAYVADNKYFLHIISGGKKYILICDFILSNPLKKEFWWSVMQYADDFSCLHRRTDGYLYAGDATNGYIYKLGKEGDSIPYSDNGIEIDAYFYFPDTDFSFLFADAGIRNKLMPKFWVTAKRWNTDTTMTVKPFYNGTPGKDVIVHVSEAIDAMQDMTRAGDMEYDTYRVDLSEQVDVVEPLFKHWGCKIQNNVVNQGLTVYKIGGEIRFLPTR